MKQTRKLTFPAPNRCWHRAEGGWHSLPWTVLDVLTAQDGGAWFKQGLHDFEGRSAAGLALSGSLPQEYLEEQGVR
jgi:hypothetical protein